MRKPKRKFSEQEKRKSVDEYLSGRRSAAQVAESLSVPVGFLYKWKTKFEEQAKGIEVDQLESTGRSREDAKLIADLIHERDQYQKMVGEQAMIVELLKKRLQSTSSAERSALTGLIETLERAALKRKPGRS